MKYLVSKTRDLKNILDYEPIEVSFDLSIENQRVHFTSWYESFQPLIIKICQSYFYGTYDVNGELGRSIKLSLIYRRTNKNQISYFQFMDSFGTNRDIYLIPIEDENI